MTTTRYAVAARGLTEGGGKGFALIELSDPDDAELDAVAEELGLHPDDVRVAAGEHRRPQLRALEGVLSVVVLTPTLDEAAAVELGQVAALVTQDAVALVGRDAGTVLADVREQLAGGATRPAEVLLALLAVVAPVLDEVLFGLDEDTAEVEGQVFSADRTDHTKQIYSLKRELLELRRATAPLTDVVDRLGTEPSCPVPDALRDDFLDLLRRVARTAEGVDHLDGLIDGVLDAQLAQIGVRQNEDQRKISAWAAVALVPTVVGGIYGMNFEHMPELSWRLGYPAALAVIATSCVSLYLGFRRNGWL